MNQTLLVGSGQAGGDLPANAKNLQRGQGTILIDLLLQRLAADVLHDQVGSRLFIDGVDGDDVLVPDGGGGAGFTEEALPGRPLRHQLRGEHLHRHHPVQLLVESTEDRAEPPLPQHLQKVVGTQVLPGC